MPLPYKVTRETHTCFAASSWMPTIKSRRPSPFQSTTAGRQRPPGMPWNGLGDTSTKCFPDLNSKSESPSGFLKITSKSPSPSQSTTMGSWKKYILMSSNTKNGFATAASRTKCLDWPRQPWRSLVSHHQPNAGNGNRRRTKHFMAVRLRCPWDSRSRNSLVSGFSRIICFLHSRQCAVPAYNVLKHQEIKQSFEVWCTLLFKLKAIEAKCHTAGYRECASQQIPTQVLLHNNKKWTNLEQLSQRRWYIRPECLSPLIPSCYWTNQVTVRTRSSRSTCQPANISFLLLRWTFS